MTFDPTVQQRNETFRTAMNHQVPWTSDVDDQPTGDWVGFAYFWRAALMIVVTLAGAANSGPPSVTQASKRGKT
jgi:hypothetical protein